MKEFGLAVWSKCRLSYLGVVGLIPGHVSLWKLVLGEYVAPVKLCMMDGTEHSKVKV